MAVCLSEVSARFRVDCRVGVAVRILGRLDELLPLRLSVGRMDRACDATRILQ